MRRGWLLCLLLAGCIEDTGGSPSTEGDGADAARAAADGGHDATVRADAAPASDAGFVADAALASDAAAAPEDLCAAYCGKVQACLVPVCPALEGGGRELCRAGCRQPEGALRAAIDAPCEAFVAGLFEDFPMLATFCSDAPPPPECAAICERAAACGVPGGREGCVGACRTLGDEQRRCLSAAESCQDLARCAGGEPENAVERYCRDSCLRRARCVVTECAPGTLPDGYAERCRQDCLAHVPTVQEVETETGASCEGVVAIVRAEEPAIDARCDNTPEAACAVLCEEVFGPCGIDPGGDCAAACADWAPANLRCLEIARDCDAARACVGDPEGQARCDRLCTRLQGCLEEACPPRIVPPELSVQCTAGCLDAPPSAEDVERWGAATCAEVRGFVYRENPQLRPVCEGGGDFRPTPEECAAFCDEALGECLGVGGRNFCLAGCASLTRDQYGCALAAQGDCGAIAGCLEPAP